MKQVQQQFSSARNNLILTENPGFRFSASTINLYLRCPRQFYYSRLLHLSTPDRPAAAFGRYLHHLLEKMHEWAFMLKTRPEAEAALARFWEVEAAGWPEFAAQLGPVAQAEALREQARRIMQEYLELEYGRKIAPNSTLYEAAMQENFRIGPYQLAGRIDRIDLFGDDAEIIDYKTGRKNESQNAIIKQFLNLSESPKWRPSDYQLPLYYFYWLQFSGQPPRALSHYQLRANKGVRIIRVEVRPGPVPPAEQGKSRRTYLYEGDMERVRGELIALLDEINQSNGNFPPNPANGLRECERCPFSFACEGPGEVLEEEEE